MLYRYLVFKTLKCEKFFVTSSLRYPMERGRSPAAEGVTQLPGSEAVVKFKQVFPTDTVYHKMFP